MTDIEELCKIYHLKPDSIISITLSFGSDPDDCWLKVITVKDERFMIRMDHEMDGIKL